MRAILHYIDLLTVIYHLHCDDHYYFQQLVVLLILHLLVLGNHERITFFSRNIISSLYVFGTITQLLNCPYMSIRIIYAPKRFPPLINYMKEKACRGMSSSWLIKARNESIISAPQKK